MYQTVLVTQTDRVCVCLARLFFFLSLHNLWLPGAAAVVEKKATMQCFNVVFVLSVSNFAFILRISPEKWPNKSFRSSFPIYLRSDVLGEEGKKILVRRPSSWSSETLSRLVTCVTLLWTHCSLPKFNVIVLPAVILFL